MQQNHEIVARPATIDQMVEHLKTQRIIQIFAPKLLLEDDTEAHVIIIETNEGRYAIVTDDNDPIVAKDEQELRHAINAMCEEAGQTPLQ